MDLVTSRGLRFAITVDSLKNDAQSPQMFRIPMLLAAVSSASCGESANPTRVFDARADASRPTDGRLVDAASDAANPPPSDAASPFDAPRALDAPAPIDAPFPADAPPLVARSLVFDGIDDLATVSGLLFPTNLTALTVEAWIKPSATNGTRSILAKNLDADYQSFFLQTNLGYPEVGVRGDTNSNYVASGSLLSSNVWTHIAMTWTPSTLRIYINGALAQTQVSAAMVQSSNDLLIGAALLSGMPTRRFSGAIDEIKIWNVVRSQAELQANMSSYATGAEAGLMAYWDFNNDNTQQILDRSPNQRHGTLGATSGIESSDPTISTDTPF